MKYKFTAKQIKLIINLISLIIFIVSYFYIYQTNVDKTKALTNETLIRKEELRDRLERLAKEDSLREQLTKVNQQKQTIIDRFPVFIGDEDNFLFVEQMESAVKVKTSSINSSDPVMLYETILPIKEEPGEAPETPIGTNSESGETPKVMIATSKTLSMSFITDYRGFKEMADYISKYPDPTIIESVAVSSDKATGVLAGNLVLKRFALSGTGKKYEVPSIDGIDIGIDNIFGSGYELEE